MWGPGLFCGCLCKPCLVKLPTLACDPHGFAATGKDGVTVSLKNGGGTVVSTGASAGMVGSLTLGAHGTGYTSAPTVTFSAPPTGGTPAQATCTISGGTVNALTLTDPGLGYTAAPTVGFTGGGGSGATATATFAHGARLTAPGAATYTATYSLAGYTDRTASITVSNCSNLTTAASQTMDTTIAGWPVTPLNGTDTVFGSFTLTNAGGYTVTKTVSGQVFVTNCTTPVAGTFPLTYQLTYSTCGPQLLVSWPGCNLGCSTGWTDPQSSTSGSLPIGTGWTGGTPLCGGIACVTQVNRTAATVQSSPLLLSFTIPAMTPCGVGTWPYPSGATITITP